MNQSATLLIGKMIRGYCLEELLTYDDATATYRARTRELWQIPEVLITVLLLPEHFSSGSELRSRFRDRFLQEAQDIATLRHHYLLPLYGCGEQDGLLYLLGPKMPGETLADQMRHKKRWTPEEALALLTPLASVLDYIHEQGLAYQFLQPTRIILQSSVTIQLEGLGRCSLLRKQGLTEESQPSPPYERLKSITNAYLGAPQYIAPEVLKGAKADRRSDVYSLGVLLCELLSGKLVFAEQDYLTIAEQHVREPLPALRELAPDMPASLELVLNRALSRNPERRFQRPAALLNAYSQMLDLRLQQPAPVRLVQQIEQMFLAPPAQAAPLQLQAPTSARLPASHKKLQELAAPSSQPQSAAPQPLPAQVALPAPVAPAVPVVPAASTTSTVSAVPSMPAASANGDALSSASSEETLLMKRGQFAGSTQNSPAENQLVFSAASNADYPRRKGQLDEDTSTRPVVHVGEEINSVPVTYGNGNNKIASKIANKVTRTVDSVPQSENPFESKVVPDLAPIPQEEDAFALALEQLEKSLPPEEVAEVTKEATEVVPSENKTESETRSKAGSEPVAPFEESAKTQYSSLLEELAKTQYSVPSKKEDFDKEQSDPVKEAVTDEVILYPVSPPGIEQAERVEQPLTDTDASRSSTQPASAQVMAMAGQLRELKARLQAQSRATGIRRLDDNAGTPATVRQASRLP
jgi:serine/threonine protein kinase